MMVVDQIQLYEQAAKPTAFHSIEDYLPLVKRIAQHMMVRMPASVQLDDLIQAGTIGLLEAAKKFDASQGASFETYAGIRIRGSIIDEIRKGDWVPRSVHKNARQINDAIVQLEAQLGRDASSSEIAESMKMDINEYHSMCQDVVSGRLFSIDEPVGDEDNIRHEPEDRDTFATPHEASQKSALQQSLGAAIKELPEREQLVLSLYYNDEMNLKEIGQILEVSESRVSQIHSQAALRLRSKLRSWT